MKPRVSVSHRFCVAPMMDWTDRHCRYFMRLLSRRALLYTEMVTTGAVIHGGDVDRFLGYHEAEHPLALQLGGSNSSELAQCTKLAHQRGYDEVNLNAGCPSDRVQNNMIGACLMAEPTLVKENLRAMMDAAPITVTLKTRIGIDDLDSDEYLLDFIGQVAESGCQVFILHARIALLQGLSPKQNREVPPLNYERAALIKQHFPDLTIVLNGGIKSLPESQNLLGTFDGVMMGREAYQHPWVLAGVDPQLYSETPPYEQRLDVIEALYPYIEKELKKGARLNHMTRHLLGLYQGQPGAKRFRRYLSENAHLPGAGIDTLEKAVSLVNETTLEPLC